MKRIEFVILSCVPLLILFALLCFASAAAPASAAVSQRYNAKELRKDGSQSDCAIPSLTHETIQSGVNDAQCKTLNLAASVYQENVLITRSIAIIGQGPLSTTVDGGSTGGVFTIIVPEGAVTVTQIAITNGAASSGGGIYFYGGSLVINGVRFIDNDTVGSYPDGRGGGLYLGASSSVSIFNSVIDGNDADAGAGLYSEAASLHIISSKITSNTASSYGGGVAHIGLTAMSTAQILSTTISGNSALNFDGGVMNSGASTTTISASTIAFNSAAVQGGGIGNYEGGVLAVVNSTISSNEAASGGGIYNESIATLLNSTIVTNGASNGGNIYVDSGGTLELANSIVAMNTLGNDCAGIVSSLGHNIDSDGSCSLLDPDDLPNTNPLLGSLGENGGPTWTHDLTLSSPALDAGDNVCCPAVDQRGVSRPQLGSCDIGAVEYDGQLQFNLPLIQGTYSG